MDDCMIPSPSPSSSPRARDLGGRAHSPLSASCGLCLAIGLPLTMAGVGCVIPEPDPSGDAASSTGADDSPSSTGADDSPSSTGVDDPPSPTGSTTVTSTEGSSSGSSSGTDTDGATSETDEPPVECPSRDESVSAAFSVAIDGGPIVIDYSMYSPPESSAPEEWAVWDTEPEIDGACEVMGQAAGSLTLTCPDLAGVTRTFELQLSASELLTTDVGPGPVHLWYLVNENNDELEANPDTIAHAFVVSNDDGIVLAGIDGRYSVYSSLSTAWPSWPSASIGDEPCDVVGEFPLTARRTLADFALEDGSSLHVYDGSTNELGGYRLLVEIATTEFADDRFGEEVDVDTARFLLGLPSA